MLCGASMRQESKRGIARSSTAPVRVGTRRRAGAPRRASGRHPLKRCARLREGRKLRGIAGAPHRRAGGREQAPGTLDAARTRRATTPQNAAEAIEASLRRQVGEHPASLPSPSVQPWWPPPRCRSDGPTPLLEPTPFTSASVPLIASPRSLLVSFFRYLKQCSGVATRSRVAGFAKCKERGEKKKKKSCAPKRERERSGAETRRSGSVVQPRIVQLSQAIEQNQPVI